MIEGTTLARRNDKPTIYERLSSDLPINSQVAEAVVDDPLERGAKLKVLRSVRDDPLAGMHARGQIDDAMMGAGRLWQRFHEHAEIGGVSAIDPTKEPVDGGKLYQPESDRMSKAIGRLKQADEELGDYGASLVRDILGRRMAIVDVADARAMTRRVEIEYLGKRFRECLDTLAVLWGYRTKP